MEPRRIALAVLLIAAVFVVTPILFPSARSRTPVAGADSSLVKRDSVSRPADTLRGDNTRLGGITDSAARLAATATPATRPAGTMGAAGVTDTVNAANVPIPVDTASIQTSRAVFRTTNAGAALIGAEMTQYPALARGGKSRSGSVELAASGDRLLSYRLVVPGDTIALDRTLFTETRTQDQGRSVVRYDATVATHPVSITYSFLPDSYRVNVAVSAGATGANTYLLVDMPSTFRSSEADSTEDRRHLSYAFKPEKRSAQGVGFGSLDPGERRIEPGPHTWVVAKNKYFLVGLLTPTGQPGFAELDVTGGVRQSKQATRAHATVVVPLRNGATTLEVYAGPQEFKRMVAMGREFETSNPYGGWLQGVVQPFATIVIRALLWMKQTLGLSYGWILVIFGVAVRLVLWPLNQRAMRSSMQMQRIQPEIQAVQARYKSDPQKLQQEIMRVYKEHGMSPFSSLSGCLPMLIPLPVFFALFFVFQNTIEFRGVSFLWFPDISLKDPYYIIPILVAITAMLLSWIGMRGVKGNDQQKMMMYMMPAMMLIIFLNMASGLNLYYLVQNLASLPQQWLISQERSRAMPLVRG